MGVEIEALPQNQIFLQVLKNIKMKKSFRCRNPLFEPDFEKINEIKPDVTFISGRQSKVYEELNKIAPTIYLSIDDKRLYGFICQKI